MWRLTLLVGLCLAWQTNVDSQETKDERPFGLSKREPWTTSRVMGTPEPPPPYTVERIYPELTFKSPICIAQEPGTDRIVVAEHDGKIFAFSKTNPTADSKVLFLETKRQIYSFSFHPNYIENGQIFVFSPTEPKIKAEDQQSRVSRFRTNLDGVRTADPNSEEILIEWPAGGHNGGEALIGPDGYLYICTGDSTGGSDPKATGQGVDDLLSVMMRIDVDHPDPGRKYSIPKDNPFLHVEGAKPEIWAFGFRNPWRFSFDDAGRLWCGDVGQDLWEMIWLVERGGNYGWSVQEGSHPFHPQKKIGPGPISPPIVEHHHTECRSITGGYMYHGAKHPELDDVYFYGDYEYGMIWGFRFDGTKAVEHRVLANTALKIPTFAVTRDGEILLPDYHKGELYELVKADVTEPTVEFPRKLSETGLFTSVKDHQLAPGILSYSVNTPQWIDHGIKERFVGLPGDSQVKFIESSSNATSWEFVDGTVAAETISLDMEDGNPASRRRIETRIIVQQKKQWLGYSYLWNDEQTDAELVGIHGIDIPLQRASADAPGTFLQQTWHVPSRNECMVCHARAAAFVLGLRTVQMNGDHDYAGVVDNQLRAWNHAGVFAAPLEKSPADYAALRNPYDDTADLNDRARAYLHVNCSVCHVSDGGGNAKMVLTFDTKPEEMKLLNEKPMHGDFGLDDAHLVSPGDPLASVLFYRLAKIGRGRMPHVGSKLTDDRGLALMRDWIQSLPPAETATNTSTPRAWTDLLAEYQSLQQSNTPQPEIGQQIARTLKTTRGALALATAAVDERFPEAIRSAVIAQGIAEHDANLRDLFERFIPEDRRTKLLGENFDIEPVLRMSGDVESGRELFSKAAGLQCRNCHRIGEIGETFGADLNQVGKRYQRYELMESLVDPSRKIDPKYVTYVLITHDGKVLSGLLVEKTDQETVLRVLKDGLPEVIHIPATDIEEMTPQTKSLMPDNQLRDLTAQQAADLLEYLSSLK